MEFLRNLGKPEPVVNEQFVLCLRVKPRDASAIDEELYGSAPRSVAVGAVVAPGAAATAALPDSAPCRRATPVARPDETHASLAGESSSPEARGNNNDEPDGRFASEPWLTHKLLHRPVYPKSSEGLCCMWDTCPFDTAPVAIPVSYDIQTDTYASIGMFCSLACAAAYNMADHRVCHSVRHERHALIAMLHAGECRAPHQGFVIAPERECLRKFGGSLSIEQFRSTSQAMFQTRPPPFRPYAVYQMHSPEVETTRSENMRWTDILLNQEFGESDKDTATAASTPALAGALPTPKASGLVVKDTKDELGGPVVPSERRRLGMFVDGGGHAERQPKKIRPLAR